MENTVMLGKSKGKRRIGWQRMRRLVSITDSMHMDLHKFWETLEDRKVWCDAFHVVTKRWT